MYSDVSVHVQMYKQVQISADKIKAKVLASARFSSMGYTGNVSVSSLQSWFLGYMKEKYKQSSKT